MWWLTLAVIKSDCILNVSHHYRAQHWKIVINHGVASLDLADGRSCNLLFISDQHRIIAFYVTVERGFTFKNEGLIMMTNSKNDHNWPSQGKKWGF